MINKAATNIDLDCRLVPESGLAVHVETHTGGTLWLITEPNGLDDTNGRLIASGGSFTLESGMLTIPLHQLRMVGPKRVIYAGVAGDVDMDAFDRNVRLLGGSGQESLRGLHAGVVGLSGTGSPVFEQLVRLGVGQITAIDPKVMSSSNLTRIHGSARADIGRPKSAIAQDYASRIGLDTRVNAVHGTVLDREVAELLRSCDVIFACTDEQRGRNVLSRLAYRYLIPVFNVGVEVDSRNSEVSGIYGRLTVVGPGLPCLSCSGQVDAMTMRAEALSTEERHALLAEGYIKELPGEAPAVISYTTAVASLAISEFLNRAFNLGEAPPHQLMWFHRGRLNVDERVRRPGCYCSDVEFVGRGDGPDFLDLGWPK